MAEIHPNDIGLATFADVGDVQALRTKAKILVEAVNEVYESGGQINQCLGTQMYVDGEDNVIIGENNTVFGNNNLVIGNNNVINGSNYNLIRSGKTLYSFPDISIDYIDISNKKYITTLIQVMKLQYPLPPGIRL